MLSKFGFNAPYMIVLAGAIAFIVLFLLTPTYFTGVFTTLFFTSIIWLPLLLLWFFVQYWADFVQAQNISKFKYVLLELKFPSAIDQKPEAMEFFLGTLWSPGREMSPYHKWVKGGSRPQWSLELAAFDGKVHFFIRTEDSQVETLRTRISNFYPGVDVVEVDDYTQQYLYNPETMDLTGLEFMYKNEPHAYPIPTYVEFEKEGKSDPITHILSVLSACEPGQHMWIQFIMRANKPTQRKGLFGTYDRFKTEAEAELHKIESRYSDGAGPAKINLMTDVDKKKAHAIERSLSKNVFEVGIRGIYFAEKDDFSGRLLGALFSIFHPFADSQVNFLMGARWFFAKYPFPWSDIGNFFKNRDKKKLFKLFQERSYFYLPYKQRPNFMTIDEIATLFHPPQNVDQYAGISSSGPKKAPPPHNLPV